MSNSLIPYSKCSRLINNLVLVLSTRVPSKKRRTRFVRKVYEMQVWEIYGKSMRFCNHFPYEITVTFPHEIRTKFVHAPIWNPHEIRTKPVHVPVWNPHEIRTKYVHSPIWNPHEIRTCTHIWNPHETRN